MGQDVPDFFGHFEQLVLFTTVQLNPHAGARTFYTYWPRLYLRTGMEPRYVR